MAKSLTTPSFFDQITSIKEIVDNRFELTGDEIALHHLMKQNQVGKQSNFVVLDLFSFSFILDIFNGNDWKLRSL